MAAFTLAHLSDPHLPPLPRPRLTELAGKRAFGYLNWTRNRHLYHRHDVLDVLISDLQAQVPDHIAITGDLVNLALEAEFTLAKAWLETVGPPQRVTVVPGNHDAYVRSTAHRFSETWGSYLAGAAPPRPACFGQRVLGCTDPAADGNGMAGARPDGCA
jgi:3',5'-cyclic AMP phosphodiesterase CpdA